MDIHLVLSVRVPQDVDVVNSRCTPREWGERPAFFPAHVDSYGNELEHFNSTTVFRSSIWRAESQSGLTDKTLFLR